MGPKGFSGEPPENRMMDRGKKTMKYRQLGKTGLQVSEIGLGSEAFVNQGEAFALELIDTAVALGINYFDCYNSEPYVRSYLGKGMEGRRKNLLCRGKLDRRGSMDNISAPETWTWSRRPGKIC